MRAFPEHFDFSRTTWVGPRAEQYERREDAFQQLVGDALLETLEAPIRVMSTAGRDGGIDAIIDDDALLPFASTELLPGPIIIECKDNNDSLGRAADNVRTAWKKVAQKLKEQAAAGWPSTYRPWATARTYVYITSAKLPHAQASIDLQRQIEDLFVELRRKRRSSIERVVVADWGTLRPILDRHPRLADRWLGVGHIALRSQTEQIEGLAGFKEYLVKIPFVPPDPRSPAHPDRLLQLVDEQAHAGRGVLLVGAGGVGKTRTLLEVGDRAEKAGWRVLHVIPGEALRTSELAQRIFAGGMHTLLLCDYFEQMPLDLLAFRQQLLPGANDRGLRIALLASGRSERAVQGRHGAQASFFDVVRLVVDAAQLRRVGEAMETLVAPQATAALGAAKVRALAGDRPIIALFVLQELERLAGTRQLGQAELSTIRPGALRYWLKRHLAEDALVSSSGSSPWEPEESPTLLAAAAGLAACPARTSNVCMQVRAVLRHAGPDERARERAEHIVHKLIELGWIEDTDNALEAAHDAVTDQLLEEVLSGSDGRVRRKNLNALLRPCRRAPRALEQMAIALGRLVSPGGGFAQHLAEHAQRWFKISAPEIGAAFVSTTPTRASRALMTILSGPLWAQSAIERWSDVIEPWIERHAAAGESWPVLYALSLRKDLPGQLASRLITIAHAWLEQHQEDEHAVTILVTMLERADVDPSLALRLIEIAWSWYERHHSLHYAAFVLGALLERDDLTPKLLNEIGPTTIRWCAEHPEAAEAGFALGMLLVRSDIGPEVIRNAKATMWAWLDRHQNTKSAGFALAMLLKAHKQGTKRWSRAVDMGLSWLERHAGSLQAGILLGELLQAGEKRPSLVPHVLSLAWPWLGRYEQVFEVVFLLPGLLSVELQSEQFLRAMHGALGWIKRYGKYVHVQELLRRLFHRADIDPESAEKVDRAGFSWLQENHALPQAALVLALLIERPSLPADIGPQAAAMALEWLDRNPDHRLFRLMIATALACEYLGDNDAQHLAEEAVTWLEAHPGGDAATITLGSILRRTNISPSTVARAWPLALTQIEANGAELDSYALLHAALARNDLDAAQASLSIATAQQWLDRHADHLLGGNLVIALLWRDPLDPRVRGYALGAALRWLRRYRKLFDARHVLLVATKRGAPEGEAKMQLADAIRAWLREYLTRAEAGGPLACLLRLVSTQAPEAGDIHYALAWIEIHGHQHQAFEVLMRLALRGDLPADTANFVVSRCLSWIDDHGLTEEAALVLESLFFRAHLIEADLHHLTRAAVRWIDKHGNCALAGLVLSGLLRAALLGSQAATDISSRIVADSWRWLCTYPDEASSSNVLGLLLAREDLPKSVIDSMKPRAIAWLDKHGRHPDSWRALTALNVRWGRDQHIGSQVSRIATDWLLENRGHDQAHFVAAVLLAHAQLERGDLASVHMVALHWLGRFGPLSESTALIECIFDAPSLRKRSARIDPVHVERLVTSVRSGLESEAFDLACLAMPALLAVTVRTRDAGTQRKVRLLVKKALQDPRMRDELRDQMWAACGRLLEAGAWPKRAEAVQSLGRLGLRPERDEQATRRKPQTSKRAGRR